MLKKLARLFVIKTRFEAFAVIYAIAVGAKILDATAPKRKPGHERRRIDRRAQA